MLALLRGESMDISRTSNILNRFVAPEDIHVHWFYFGPLCAHSDIGDNVRPIEGSWHRIVTSFLISSGAVSLHLGWCVVWCGCERAALGILK
jgi:hypothetical protein